MIVCVCHGVTREAIDQLLQNGANSFKDVAKQCQAGQDCGTCALKIQKMIQESSRQKEALLEKSAHSET